MPRLNRAERSTQTENMRWALITKIKYIPSRGNYRLDFWTLIPYNESLLNQNGSNISQVIRLVDSSRLAGGWILQTSYFTMDVSAADMITVAADRGSITRDTPWVDRYRPFSPDLFPNLQDIIRQDSDDDDD